MSVDSRLQYLWKPQLGDTEPPPQQEDGTVDQQQSAQRGSNSGQDISPATIGVPVSSQGPQTPRQKKKTADQSRDCRDRWRLGAEIATAIIGAIGLAALVVTLDQSRRATEAALQSVVIARKQSERHVTGFVHPMYFTLDPEGDLRVGDTVLPKDIQLFSGYLNGEEID